MPLTHISLNLKNINSFNPKQLEDTQISSAYAQNQQAEQPKVLYQMNTVPVENGVKASNIYLDDFYFEHAGGSSIDRPDIHIGTDNDGNESPVLLDTLPASGVGANTMWVRPVFTASQDEMQQVLVRPARENFISRWYTLFQNKTYYMDFGDSTFQFSVNGDTPADTGGVFTYNFQGGSVQYSNLSGIDLNSIGVLGITSYQNYLMFFTSDTLYWSNPIDFTDFTPSVGGGGNTKIAEARGNIVTIVPTHSGLMIYCSANIILASFTGDSTTPWIFTEVPNSSGLAISSDRTTARALVAVNEQQQQHWAVLDTGISVVDETGVTPAPETLQEFTDAPYFENKVEGAATITRDAFHYIIGGGEQIVKVKALHSFGQFLFITLGHDVETSDSVSIPTRGVNRLVVYNTITGAYGTIDGNIAGIIPKPTYVAHATDVKIHKKPRTVPLTFLVVKRFDAENDIFWPLVLDMGSLGTDSTAVENYPDVQPVSEVMVGEVNISDQALTELHEITLTGNLGEGVEAPDVDTRVRVFAFSETTMGKDVPVEFIYNPLDGKYYGYITGKDIRILLQGKYFFLTKLTLGLLRGGEF